MRVPRNSFNLMGDPWGSHGTRTDTRGNETDILRQHYKFIPMGAPKPHGSATGALESLQRTLEIPRENYGRPVGLLC